MSAMTADAIITEGIMEILKSHQLGDSGLSCKCGYQVANVSDHQYHVAERLSANVDYWFGLKRFR